MFSMSENTIMFLAMKVSDFIFYYMDRVVSYNICGEPYLPMCLLSYYQLTDETNYSPVNICS